VTGLSGKPEKLYSDGLHVGGERFVLTKAEDRSLYARKVSTLSQPLLHPNVQYYIRRLRLLVSRIDCSRPLILHTHRAEKVLLSSRLPRQFSLLTTAME
jgi:hypothetical protein